MACTAARPAAPVSGSSSRPCSSRTAPPHVGAQVHLAVEWRRLLLSNANVVVLEGGFDARQAQGYGEER